MSIDRVFLLMAVALSMPSVLTGKTNVFYGVRYVYNNAGDVVAIRRYTNETSYVERTYEYDYAGRRTRKTVERFDGTAWTEEESVHDYLYDGWYRNNGFNIQIRR